MSRSEHLPAVTPLRVHEAAPHAASPMQSAASGAVVWLLNRIVGAKAGSVVSRQPRGEADGSGRAMQRHHEEMRQMRLHMLWTQFVVVGLGAWLLTSPIQFALFTPEAAATVRDISGERNLWDPATRNALAGWNDMACGAALMLLGAIALRARWTAARWAVCFVGLWLMAAPLVFWTPSAAVYANDTAVGALAITFSVLVPMMPGMSHEGMMDASTLPQGWTYNPSTWTQRLPIIALGFFGFLIARYLAAYQFGHVTSVWDPFFSGRGDLNGTEDIITSDVSRAFPVSDAALGAYAYMLETLMGAMGSEKRWRTMPWMVTFFFILVVPLGAVSIGFIIIQPIMIGTYCTLCLVQAFAMLVMIPLALDEVVATLQFLRRAKRDGQPMLRTFFQGGADPASRSGAHDDFTAPLGAQARRAVQGVTLPWTLAASCFLGVWMMFSRAVFEREGTLANSDHLMGALTITFAVIAMAEVARPLRFVNILFAAWLIASGFVIGEGAIGAADWNAMIAGVLIAALSLPRGRRSRQRYGGWDRWIV